MSIIGGGEIMFEEGTTQCCSGHALAIMVLQLPRIAPEYARPSQDKTKFVVYTDDITGAWELKPLTEWYKVLAEEGPKFNTTRSPIQYNWLLRITTKL